MSSIGKLMKQAARMQQQMEQVQAGLAIRTVEATSGGGAVKVVAKCDGSIASIKIDPQAINPADAQLLEDMVLTAANQALSQAKEVSTAEMGKVTAGFNLPGFGYESGASGLMAALPDSLSSLISALSTLPGIGPPSAERIALHLVQAESGAGKHL